nr:TetR/AcrR family transcriptional regulator [uncultured Halomonas sp.]
MAVRSSENKRPRGRPRSIDKDAVLDKILEVFWKKGYEGTSLDDLTQAAGISRPSLYAALGDKRAVFLAVLDHYATGIGAEPMRAFAARSDIFEAVHVFLMTSLDNNTRPDGAQGCLLACCASTSSGHVEGVDEQLAEDFANLRALLTQRFVLERDNGVLNADPGPATRASLVIDLMTTQAIRARAGVSRCVLANELADKVRVILA